MGKRFKSKREFKQNPEEKIRRIKCIVQFVQNRCIFSIKMEATIVHVTIIFILERKEGLTPVNLICLDIWTGINQFTLIVCIGMAIDIRFKITTKTEISTIISEK